MFEVTETDPYTYARNRVVYRDIPCHNIKVL